MADRVLSQQEIDRVFRTLQNKDSEDIAKRAQPYDFRRPDRIAKEQLRSIHLLHETFARSLGSSLSAFLRAYVAVNLVSVEQLSFTEFSRSLPSPTCLLSLGILGFDNNALLELNPSCVFPILEILLGGSGASQLRIEREITEIEWAVLDALFRIILRDMKESWKLVTTSLDFTIEGFETEPQLLQILSPNEAVVAVSIELRVGEISGMMNIGIPSIVIKMLGQKLEQHHIRKSEMTEAESNRIMRLIRPAEMRIDCRLSGPKLSVEDLLKLEVDDVVTFDYPVNRPVYVSVNGRTKFQGQVVVSGRKRAVELGELVRPGD
jgi:flagellar motor switch protein FliM